MEATQDAFLTQLQEIEAEAQPKSATPKRGTAAKSIKLADLKRTLGTVIEGANQALINFTVYGKYALNDEEQKALVEAAAAEVQASKRMTSALASASKITPHMQTIQVLSMIGLSRWVMYQQDKAGTSQPETIVPFPASNGARPNPVADIPPAPVAFPIQDGTEPPPLFDRTK